MPLQNLNADYWNQRYQNGETGWDIGYASPALVQFAQSIAYKTDVSVLIPGCGNAHEAEALIKQGFEKITLIDFATLAVEKVRKKYAQYIDEGKLQVICTDFFEHKGAYDYILEQTFFCALPPEARPAYAKKMHELLNPNGILAGLYFDFPLTSDGPPFGGSKNEYVTYFSPYFEMLKFDKCEQSIPPRMGRELFGVFKKK